MARINLLPWRAERRKQRQREFQTMLGGALIVGLIAVFVAMIDASAPALTAGKLLTEHRSLRARLQRSASLFPPAPVNLVSVTPDMVLPPHQGLPVLRPRPARVALETLTLDGLSVGYGAGAPMCRCRFAGVSSSSLPGLWAAVSQRCCRRWRDWCRRWAVACFGTGS